MAQTYTINGVDYTFPDVDDSDWGQNVTDWAGAVSSFLLQRTGGTFTLSAAIDFGSSYGLKLKDIESKTTSPAAAGFMRLAKTDVIAWKNDGGTGDVTLAKKAGTDNFLQFNSIDLVNLSTAQTLTNKTLTSPVISGATLDGMTAIVFEGATPDDFETTLTVTDPTADRTWTIPDATDTAVGKDTTDTLTNKTLTSPKMNEDVAMTTTSTYLNRMDATSSVQTQLDAKQATITGAATTITGADLSTSKVLQSNGSGKVEASSVTTTTLGYLDASSSIQTQIDSKQATITGAATTITGADLATSKVLQSNGSGKVEASSVTTTTLGYLDASSSVQTQLDAKAPLASPYFTTYADFDSQGSAPAAPSNTGDVRLYAKDSKFYFHPQGGSATEVGSGGGAGDADTIQLKAANDFDAVNTAPWYTGNDLVPGGGGTIGGTWELSTSNPLINTNDATKVFHYSNGTSNRKGDYFEIELDVPNYAKGHNLVVQLFYRTVGAEDADFLFFARDRTADYSTETSSAQGATNNVAVDSSTGFAVGDRICFEDSSNARHFRYVTAVPDGTHVTFSGAAAAFDDAAAIVTKFFTDELNYITAENNTTNYEGKIRKWAFQINDTTTKIRVGFLYDNSATSTNELFFDQILLSSNQFLQTSSQGQTELYEADQPASNSYADNTGVLGLSTALMTGGTATAGFSKFIEISGSPTKFEVIQDCKINFYFSGHTNTANRFLSLYKNTTSISADGYFVGGAVPDHGSTTFGQIDTTFEMKKGNYFTLAIGDMGGNTTSTMNTSSQRTQLRIRVEPLVNDVVLLNSQDEIFTDWVSYTPTGDYSSNCTYSGKWRRVGDTMEVQAYLEFSGSPGGSFGVDLPSGYTIDLNKMPRAATDPKNKVGFLQHDRAGSYYVDGTVGINTTSDGVLGYIWAGDGVPVYATSVTTPGTDDRIYVQFKVPIAGWTSTFNPVLSMPLVDIGADTEQYLINGWTARAATVSVHSSNTPMINTISSLGTITNDSTNGFGFTASTRVVVDFGFSCMSTGYQYAGIIKNSAPLDPTAAAADNKKIATAKGEANQAVCITAETILETGESLWIGFNANGTLEDSNYSSFANVLVRRDRGQTNMAHIIKPAICVFSHVLPYNSDGGGTATGWDTREINTVEGESWFCSVNQSTDVITVDPGMYRIKAWQTISRSGAVAARIYSTTNSNTLIKGTTATVPDANYISLVAEGVKTFTAAHSFRWEYEAYEASGGGDAARGLGMAASHSGSSESWVASYVIVEKLK